MKRGGIVDDHADPGVVQRSDDDVLSHMSENGFGDSGKFYGDEIALDCGVEEGRGVHRQGYSNFSFEYREGSVFEKLIQGVSDSIFFGNTCLCYQPLIP